MDKVARQTEVLYLLRINNVNVADRWRERLRSYLGRSHGREEMEFESRLKQDLS